MNMAGEQWPPSSRDPNSSRYGSGYIEHRVSKLDTLAGVAIKYGVEVGDIKRMNGLVSDLQMFAHKTLKIPLPGRHPPAILPSTEGSSGSAPPPRLGKHHVYVQNPQPELTDASKSSSQDKRPVSLAISLLRGYYGLSSPAQPYTEGMEMATYKSDTDHHSEDEPFSPLSTSGTNRQERFKVWPAQRGSANGKHATEVEEITMKDIPWSDDETIGMKEVATNVGKFDTEKTPERSVRRRSKTDSVSSTIGTPDGKVLDMGTRDRIATVGKSPPPRPKTLPKTSLVADASSSLIHPFIFSPSNEDLGGGIGGSKSLGGTMVSGNTKEGLISKVRKSSSTSNLQDENILQLNSGSRYASKLDLTVSNQVSINQLGSLPFFEGLSKPAGNRRNKAALD